MALDDERKSVLPAIKQLRSKEKYDRFHKSPSAGPAGTGKKSTEIQVQAKHVDFVLCDSKLVARYIIELDDSSHNAPDRTERDQFVDRVLQAVGYKVLRLNAFDERRIEQAFFPPAT